MFSLIYVHNLSLIFLKVYKILGVFDKTLNTHLYP